MKITIILFVIAAIMLFIAGCGPGQPFETEDMYTSQSESPAHVVAARCVPISQVNITQDSGSRSAGAVSLPLMNPTPNDEAACYRCFQVQIAHIRDFSSKNAQ